MTFIIIAIDLLFMVHLKRRTTVLYTIMLWANAIVIMCLILNSELVTGALTAMRSVTI